MSGSCEIVRQNWLGGAGSAGQFGRLNMSGIVTIFC